MAVGGLIKDLPTPVRNLRQAPHCPGPVGRRLVAAVVFAAGSSRRMGEGNKLLLEVDGKPLVAHAVAAATDAGLAPVLVVTGADADAVRAALAGYPVAFVHNSDHERGMSTSLHAGLAALPEEIDGASFLLGDMPAVSALHLRLLVEAFAPEEGRGIVVPTFGGRRGNPIVWSRRLFAEMREVTGDTGARGLLTSHAADIHLLAMPDDAVLVDIDSPEALADYRER
jgi:molybdenum cofactor cytidylyltransferase